MLCLGGLGGTSGLARGLVGLGGHASTLVVVAGDEGVSLGILVAIGPIHINRVVGRVLILHLICKAVAHFSILPCLLVLILFSLLHIFHFLHQLVEFLLDGRIF